MTMMMVAISVKLPSPSAATPFRLAHMGGGKGESIICRGGTEPLNLALADHALITVDQIVLMLGFDKCESQIDHVTNSAWETGQTINLLILMHHYRRR